MDRQREERCIYWGQLVVRCVLLFIVAQFMPHIHQRTSVLDQSYTSPKMDIKSMLSRQVQEFGSVRITHPSNVTNLLSLATACQELNRLKPDGALVNEGISAYRSALALMRLSELKVHTHSSLSALLLEAGRIDEAMEQLDIGDRGATQVSISITILAEMSYNRAKIFAASGKLKLADASFIETARLAYGTQIVVYSKAVAAARSLTDDCVVQALQVHHDTLSVAHLIVADKQVLVELKTVGRSTLLLFVRNNSATRSPAASCNDENCEAIGDQASGYGTDGSNTADASGSGSSGLRSWIIDGDYAVGDVTDAVSLEWLRNATAQDLANLGFGLHKALEKRGFYEAAWQYLANANSLIRNGLQYSVVKQQQDLSILISSFPQRKKMTGADDRTPIFVVGMPRSGSTVVQQIYSRHSAVWVAGEDTAMAPLTSAVQKRVGLADFDLEQEMRKCGLWYVTEMRSRLPKARSSPGSTLRIVDMSLENLWHIGYIRMMLPKSCIVHIERHPLDVGMSCYSEQFGHERSLWSYDLEEIAAQVLTIYYEELVSYLPQVASDLLSYCGLIWEDSVMDFKGVGTAPASSEVMPVRKPVYKYSVGMWKKYANHLKPLRDALGGSIALYETKKALALARRAAAAATAKENALEL